MQYPHPDSASEKLARLILTLFKVWAVVVGVALIWIVGFMALVTYGCSRAGQSLEHPDSDLDRERIEIERQLENRSR